MNVPLFAPLGEMAWALLNLILSALGLLLVIFIIVKEPLRKRREEREKRGAYFNNTEADEAVDDLSEDKKEKKLRITCLITAAVTGGILGPLLFLLTQDMSAVMVMIDRWTPVHALLLTAEIVAAVFVLKRDRNTAEPEEVVDGC